MLEQRRFSQVEFNRMINEYRIGSRYLRDADSPVGKVTSSDRRSPEEFERDADYVIPNHPDL